MLDRVYQSPLLIKPGLEYPPHSYGSGDCALIIGAGLAGCAVARVLTRLGFHCKLFDRVNIAAGTSAVPVAVYRPYPHTTDNISSRFFLNAYRRLLTELDQSRLIKQSQGVLQLIDNTAKWQDHEFWNVVDKTAASKLAAGKIDSAALYFPQAGTLVPGDLCDYWVSGQNRISLHDNIDIHELNKTDSGWQLINDQQKVIDEGQLVVLANSNNVNDLIPQGPLPLVPVRGQLTYFTSPSSSNEHAVVCNRGHVIPRQSGYWVGATHQRNNNNLSATVTDDRTNHLTLTSLNHVDSFNADTEQSWVGIRCTTPDRLPLAGGIPDQDFYHKHYRDLHHGRTHQSFPPARYIDGLYVCTGLGSRGVTQALYTAECLGEIITGKRQTSDSILSALHPGRFLLKQLRRRPV